MNDEVLTTNRFIVFAQTTGRLLWPLRVGADCPRFSDTDFGFFEWFVRLGRLPTDPTASHGRLPS